MVNQTITQLPTPPSTTDVVNFNDRSDNFLAAIPTFVTQTNTVIGQINSTETNINSKESSATSAASTATTQAGIAITKASEASASATSASSSAASATTKANEASTSATNASNSATTATNQATIATTKASEASASATSASSSAASATTKANEASTSATNANNSATTATTQAEIATTKAGEASVSAALALSVRAELPRGLVVETIEGLSLVPSSSEVVVVKDESRGGTFVWSATGTANGGTVFAGVSGYWHRQYDGAVNVKWFGAKGDGVTDDTASINNALSCGYYKIFAPSGTYKTTSPIEIPVLATFYGDGNTTVIKPTYSSWIGDDYRAIILETKEGINYHNRDCGKSIRDFSIEGVDSNLVQAIALDFRTKNPNSVVSSTVNFSLYSTFISNIVISRFDTALNIFELWASSFKSIFINECREAIHIEGQAINNMFSHIQATTFTNNYSSSTNNTIGIYVKSSNRYNGIERRPEGFCFDSCLIFGAYNNVKIVSCLDFKMDKMILDGGTNVCVNLINPADFILSNSYIYTTHNTLMEFSPIDAVEPQPVKILNNNFIGTTLSHIGIQFVDGGNRRQGVTISGNSFYNCGTGIYAIQCPVYSHIINNTFYGTLSYTVSNIMIRVQNGGEGTLIDGNNTLSDVTILNCHAIVTSSKLKIGTNSSKNQSTKYSGKIIIPIGSTTASVPVGWTNTENGIRFIVSITCNESTVYKYVPETNYMNGTITIPSPLSSVATFRYTTTAVPYTAI